LKILSPKIHNKYLKAFLLSKPGMACSNWLFQGMRYMNSFERTYRLLTEFVIGLAIFIIINQYFELLYSLLIASITVHSLMWIFNGQLFSLFRLRKYNVESLIVFIKDLQNRTTDLSYLEGVILFGGLCKNKYHEYSDIDVRLIKSHGFINGIKSCNCAAQERFLALFISSPIDIYVFNKIENLDIEDPTLDSPIILFDKNGLLKKKYPNAKDFVTFKNEITLNHS